jgi:hypothetical protein
MHANANMLQVHVLFDATTTTKYAILDLIVLNADTHVLTLS